MSARDKLDSYERNWAHHQNWRKPRDGGSPGRYVEKGTLGGRFDLALTFRELPADLRDRVIKRLEEVMTRLVDEEHSLLVAELRGEAITEAQRTLDELAGPQ